MKRCGWYWVAHASMSVSLKMTQPLLSPLCSMVAGSITVAVLCSKDNAAVFAQCCSPNHFCLQNMAPWYLPTCFQCYWLPAPVSGSTQQIRLSLGARHLGLKTLRHLYGGSKCLGNEVSVSSIPVSTLLCTGGQKGMGVRLHQSNNMGLTPWQSEKHHFLST